MLVSHRPALVIACSAAVGLAVGGGALLIRPGDADAGQTAAAPSAASPAAVPDFAVNKAGQTFGQFVAGGKRPDFVPGRTDAGVNGYFRSDDWLPAVDAQGRPLPAPDAKPVVPDARGDIKIRVYAFDGKTVLGLATIAHVTQETGG